MHVLTPSVPTRRSGDLRGAGYSRDPGGTGAQEGVDDRLAEAAAGPGDDGGATGEGPAGAGGWIGCHLWLGRGVAGARSHMFDVVSIMSTTRLTLRQSFG